MNNFKNNNPKKTQLLMSILGLLFLVLIGAGLFYVIKVLPERRALNAPESEPSADLATPCTLSFTAVNPNNPTATPSATLTQGATTTPTTQPETPQIYTIKFDKDGDGLDDVGDDDAISLTHPTGTTAFDLDPILYADGVEVTDSAITYVYTTSQSGIATVSENGIIQARGTGVPAIITTTATIGSTTKSRAITVNVTQSPPQSEPIYELSTDVSNLDLKPGDFSTITLTFMKDNQPANDLAGLTFNSTISNSGVIGTTQASDGNMIQVRALANGNATIAAEATYNGNNYVQLITVTVDDGTSNPTNEPTNSQSSTAPTNTTTPIIAGVGPVTLNLITKFDGIPYVENAGTAEAIIFPITALGETISVQVKIANAYAPAQSKKVNFTYNAITHNYEAKDITFAEIVSGPYNISIKGPKQLGTRYCYFGDKIGSTCNSQELIIATKTYTNLAEAETAKIIWLEPNHTHTFDLTKAPVIAGDLPIDGEAQDGVVNILDYSALIGCLKTSKSEACLLAADINYNGGVDNNDLKLLRNALSSRADQL